MKTYKKDLRLNSYGYTLIEIIIVILVMIAVGGIIIGILYSAIRGTAKTHTNTNITQNGNYVISSLSSFFANSKRLLSATDFYDSDVSYNNCAFPEPVEMSAITVQGFDNGIARIACIENTIASNSATLLNTYLVEVVPGTCKFTCFQRDLYSPPRIGIIFDLRIVGASSPEKTGSASFNTIVTMRNYGL